MRRFRNYILLSGLALVGLSYPQASFAEENKSEKPAPINEIEQGHDRGLMWKPIGTQIGGSPINSVIPATQVKPIIKPVIQAEIKNVKEKKDKAVLAHPNLNNNSKIKKTSLPVQANKTQPHTLAKTAEQKQKNTKTQNEIHETAANSEIANTENDSKTTLVKYSAESSGHVVSASLDRKGENPKYKVGEKLTVNLKAHKDCNVVVFNYDSTGTLTQIFPNEYQQNGFIRSGENVQIGGEDSPFDYQIGGKGGNEKIFVYAYPTSQSNPLTIAMAPIANSPFRSSQMTVEQYRELVNGSKSFFSREVKVVPKRQHSSSIQSVSNTEPVNSPNKIELTFSVEK